MLRTIVEDPAVTQAIDAAVADNPRVTAAFDGLKWRLARQPDAGHSLGPSGLHVHKQDGLLKGKIPGLLVLYSFDDAQVTLRRIKVVIDEGQ